MQVLAVVHAVPRLLRGGRRGREFGRPSRRAAVIVLLPAHARGRHLPGRPRPGHQCPRSGGGPPSNGDGGAGAGADASGPDTRRPPAAAARAPRSANPESPPSRDGAAPPARSRGRHRRGANARGAAAAPGPIRSHPLFSSRLARGDVGSLAPQVPLPPDTQRDSRLVGCGGRRRLGGLLRGEAGTWRRTRELRSRRYQGSRSARGGDVISPQPSSAPRRRLPRSPATGAGASCGARSECLPLRRGAPSSGRLVVSPVSRARARKNWAVVTFGV